VAKARFWNKTGPKRGGKKTVGEPHGGEAPISNTVFNAPAKKHPTKNVVGGVFFWWNIEVRSIRGRKGTQKREKRAKKVFVHTQPPGKKWEKRKKGQTGLGGGGGWGPATLTLKNSIGVKTRTVYRAPRRAKRSIRRKSAKVKKERRCMVGGDSWTKNKQPHKPPGWLERGGGKGGFFSTRNAKTSHRKQKMTQGKKNKNKRGGELQKFNKGGKLKKKGR